MEENQATATDNTYVKIWGSFDVYFLRYAGTDRQTDRFTCTDALNTIFCSSIGAQ